MIISHKIEWQVPFSFEYNDIISYVYLCNILLQSSILPQIAQNELNSYVLDDQDWGMGDSRQGIQQLLPHLTDKKQTNAFKQII